MCDTRTAAVRLPRCCQYVAPYMPSSHTICAYAFYTMRTMAFGAVHIAVTVDLQLPQTRHYTKM